MAEIEKVAKGAKDAAKRVKPADVLNKPAGLAVAGAALAAVPFAIWFGGYDLDTWTARSAPAIAISLVGVSIGVFFLSWTYKDILYMLLAASAALYAAAKANDPRVEVRLSLREAMAVCVSMAGLLAFLHVATRAVRR